jgi:hypothetical protein
MARSLWLLPSRVLPLLRAGIRGNSSLRKLSGQPFSALRVPGEGVGDPWPPWQLRPRFLPLRFFKEHC